MTEPAVTTPYKLQLQFRLTVCQLASAFDTLANFYRKKCSHTRTVGYLS